jgi:hypothetical protein
MLWRPNLKHWLLEAGRERVSPGTVSHVLNGAASGEHERLNVVLFFAPLRECKERIRNV